MSCILRHDSPGGSGTPNAHFWLPVGDHITLGGTEKGLSEGVSLQSLGGAGGL
jgi:hypothetical protein